MYVSSWTLYASIYGTLQSLGCHKMYRTDMCRSFMGIHVQSPISSPAIVMLMFEINARVAIMGCLSIRAFFTFGAKIYNATQNAPRNASYTIIFYCFLHSQAYDTWSAVRICMTTVLCTRSEVQTSVRVHFVLHNNKLFPSLLPTKISTFCRICYPSILLNI